MWGGSVFVFLGKRKNKLLRPILSEGVETIEI